RVAATRRTWPLAGCETIVVGLRDLLGLLFRNSSRNCVAVQNHRVDDWTVGEADPVVVLWTLVGPSDSLDVFSRSDAMDAPRVGNAVHVEAASLHGTTHRARLHLIRLEPVQGTRRSVFGAHLDE